jgi:hypothetical protein
VIIGEATNANFIVFGLTRPHQKNKSSSNMELIKIEYKKKDKICPNKVRPLH